MDNDKKDIERPSFDRLSKAQLVWLVLLVSFVTSLVTGIVTVTLVNQAPPPITQTINRVIEKTLEKVISSPSATEGQESKPLRVITQEDLIIQTVKNVSPAVVSVIATKDLPVIEQYYVNPFGNDPFFQQFFGDNLPQIEVPQYKQNGTKPTQVSSGSGFFVSEDGYLLTNKHVVLDKEAEYSIVLNDGRKLPAKIIARDPVQDVAILKVDGTGFKFIPLGDSDKLQVGQTVIAIGNALGEFQNTVSVGVVSGLHRSLVASGEQLQEVIQTDAAINLGNSGGPLLNLEGRVVGMSTAMAMAAESVGFALPINIAKKGIADSKEFGKIRYAYLGVRYTLSVDYGVILINGQNGESAVMKDSPADKAHLQEGDIILEYNGKVINKDNTLSKMINDSRIGDTVMLKVLRGATTTNFSVTLDERPENL